MSKIYSKEYLSGLVDHFIKSASSKQRASFMDALGQRDGAFDGRLNLDVAFNDHPFIKSGKRLREFIDENLAFAPREERAALFTQLKRFVPRPKLGQNCLLSKP